MRPAFISLQRGSQRPWSFLSLPMQVASQAAADGSKLSFFGPAGRGASILDVCTCTKVQDSLPTSGNSHCSRENACVVVKVRRRYAMMQVQTKKVSIDLFVWKEKVLTMKRNHEEVAAFQNVKSASNRRMFHNWCFFECVFTQIGTTLRSSSLIRPVDRSAV